MPAYAGMTEIKERLGAEEISQSADEGLPTQLPTAATNFSATPFMQ
jgi:hypothetical protein